MAGAYAQYVATHLVWLWYHNEAVDLWQAIPPDKRGDGAPPAIDVPAGADIARGKLLDVFL